MDWLTSQISRHIIIDDLLIRPLEVSDAKPLVEAVTESLPELKQWMPWAKYEPQSVSQREAFVLQCQKDWEAKSDFPFGIFRDEQFVGCSGLHLRHGVGQLEIGYWVRTSCTGQGIAAQTSRALTSAAFVMPEVQEVLIAHDIANVRSQSIPKKLGFTVVREYDTEIDSDSGSGRHKLWSMKRDAWGVD